jgi:hypothetical protein
MEEREASLVTNAYVLTTFRFGRTACYGMSHCRSLQRGALMMQCCRRGLFFLRPPNLRTGGAKMCKAEKTNARDVGELMWLIDDPKRQISRWLDMHEAYHVLFPEKMHCNQPCSYTANNNTLVLILHQHNFTVYQTKMM